MNDDINTIWESQYEKPPKERSLDNGQLDRDVDDDDNGFEEN
jgi:hypothetical protein